MIFFGFFRFAVVVFLVALALACSHFPKENERGTAPSQQEKIQFYLSKLSDKNYVDQYGDSDNPKVWYTAAEALGQIGAPAIPALVQRLNTNDEYELMLVLYALMLASQDPAAMKKTNHHYLELDTVLTPRTNTKNRYLARQWCQQFQSVCTPS